jgi:hypothetical protein
MKNISKILGVGFIMFLFTVNHVFAQGSTSSAIAGLLTDGSDEALIGATVVARHEPSGTTYGTATRSDGRFNMNGLRVGGPYTIRITYTGYKEQIKENVYLSLGQTYVFDLKLKEDAEVLSEVLVVAKKSLMNTEKNGASTDISEEEINVLPTVNRDLTDFARLTPQASIRGDNIISIAGANNRFNSIYIDGAVNNDVFGLAASGTNGGQTGISPISADAIEQINVVVAPYDVKLSGFSGGGINAVTRGGSNVVEGSVYYFTRNEDLAGLKVSLPDTLPKAQRKLPDFVANTIGFRLGTPIVKDKVFAFVNAEIQRNQTPQPFDLANYNGNTKDRAKLDALATRLGELGYDGLDYLEKTDKLDGLKILARLDFNLSKNHKLMVRHHYTQGESLSSQSSTNTLIRFANAGIAFPSVTNSTALELNSVVKSNMTNNLVISFTNVNDDRDPVGTPRPFLNILDGSGAINAGSEQFSTANLLEQKIFTLTDNFNIYKGKHQLTFGTHNEFFDMYNLFVRQSYGVYRFASVDDFLTGKLPNQYLRTYSLLPGDGVSDGAAAAADFKALQLGFYAQDEYTFSKKLSASLGLRVDVPMFLDDPTEATAFNATEGKLMSDAGYDLRGAVAGKAPATQLLFSPRFGFNFDVNGDNSLVIRGGAGIFTSRIPFVWPGGMYTNNGVLLASVNANAADISKDSNFVFSPDINKQYTNQSFGKTAGNAQIDLFAKDFKYPQTFRSSLAIDAKLPFGLVGTLEGIYSKTLNNIVYQNINRSQSTATLKGGPDNRTVYPGTFISSKYTDVILGYNTNEGSTYSLTAQLQKPFSGGWVGSFAYTFGQTKVINDGTSSQNSSNWVFNESVNGQNTLPLTYSDFDLGSRVVGFVSKTIKYGSKVGGATTISLFYTGESGSRFSYTYAGNLVKNSTNTGQDLIYIPSQQSDINLVDDATLGTAAVQWTNLEEFIKGDEYLNANRGKYAERNGRRTPFTNIFDLKVMQDFNVELGGRKRGLQVSLDIFNVGNLINADWGRRFFVTNDAYQLITYKGNNTATGNPEYTFKKPSSTVWNIDESGVISSLWQAQLGLRLNF